MFKRNEVISNEKINTLIGQNTKFEGVLHAEGVIRVDGEFQDRKSTRLNSSHH